jgi:hypothetical protein
MCSVLLPLGVNQMCAVLLPPGVNPVTANKHINTNTNIDHTESFAYLILLSLQQ